MCSARWTRPSATRSSPRATATRSRCWSFRARGARWISPADSDCPRGNRSRARSNRATRGASFNFPPTPSCSFSRPPRSLWVIPSFSSGPPRRSASTWPRPTRRRTPASSTWVCVSSLVTRSYDPPLTVLQPPTTVTGYIGRSPQPPTPTRTRIGAPGTALRRQRDSTRMSPRSSSTRPHGPKRGEAFPRQRPSSSAPLN